MIKTYGMNILFCLIVDKQLTEYNQIYPTDPRKIITTY